MFELDGVVLGLLLPQGIHRHPGSYDGYSGRLLAHDVGTELLIDCHVVRSAGKRTGK